MRFNGIQSLPLMPIDVTCPECEKKLRLRDEVAGKRVKCPKCGHKFVCQEPTGEEDEDNETIALAEEKRPAKAIKPAKRQRRDDDDEDEDDDDAPRKRKRSREVEQVATPIAPLIWGLLALVLPCPIVGLAIGSIAFAKANAELGNLPAGRKGQSARRNMKIAMGLGVVGCILSVVLSVVMLIIGRQ